MEQDAKQISGQYILGDEISLALAKVIRKRIDSFNEQRRAKQVEIMANIAYLVGEQNIYLEGNQVMPIKDVRMINPVANQILPAVIKDVAMATQIPPLFDVVPAGTDDDDRATAICSTKILQHLQRKIGTGFHRGETAFWYDIAGIGWRKTYWNPYKNVMGINPEPTDKEGNPNPGHNPQLAIGEAITQGELECDCIPPTQLIYDYREPDPTRLEWIIHAQRRSHQWCLDRFGPEITTKLNSKFTGVSKENPFEASVINRFNNLTGGDENQNTVTPKMSNSAEMQLDADKYIDFYEYWQKPSKLVPAGILAVMLDDQLVIHGPYPIEDYPHGELPFVPSIPMHLGTILGTSIPRISQARPLQREYNRLRAQIAENIDIMGNAVIFAPRLAKLRHKTLDNGAANIIEYDSPVGKPTREPGVPMNSQVFVYLQEIKSDLDSLFAFHEPTRGIAPRNVDSAKGIMALQSADTAMMGPIVEGFERADERVVYQALTVAAAHYETGRLLNIVGTDFEWALYKLDREQLRGKFNVIIKPFSTMPKDKETEAMKAFSVWQSGLLGDPTDPELRIWTVQQMALGNQENILQKHSKQRNFASREFSSAQKTLESINLPEGLSNDVLAIELQKYTYVPHINPFDDHMIHHAVHSEWLLDNYWKLVSTQNPLYLTLLQNLMLHDQEHAMMINQLKAAQFQQEVEAQMLIHGTTPAQLALRKAGGPDNKTDKKGE